MGEMTPILINMDSWHDAQEHPEHFVQEMSKAISYGNIGRRTNFWPGCSAYGSRHIGHKETVLLGEHNIISTHDYMNFKNMSFAEREIFEKNLKRMEEDVKFAKEQIRRIKSREEWRSILKSFQDTETYIEHKNFKIKKLDTHYLVIKTTKTKVTSKKLDTLDDVLYYVSF